jgi:hypothetical protein
VADYLAALVKVVADDLVVDGTGFVTERPIGKRGTRRLGSAVDLEATFRKHEGSPAVLGSNAVISITTTRIRAAVALTGSTPDNEAPSAVLEQQLAAGLPLPPYLVIDQIGGWGKTRARLDALSEGQTMMVARTPVSGGSDRSRFTVADFQVDAERRTCICPRRRGQSQGLRPRQWRWDLILFSALPLPRLSAVVAVPRSRGKAEQQATGVHLGLPHLSTGWRGLQPDADRTGAAGWALAARADDCVFGALSRLSAGAAGGAGGSAVPALPGLRDAQGAAVAEPPEAGAFSTTGDVSSRRPGARREAPARGLAAAWAQPGIIGVQRSDFSPDWCKPLRNMLSSLRQPPATLLLRPPPST